MGHNHQSDQRGIAQVLLVVIIVVVVAAIGYVGWKVTSNKNKGSTSNSSAPAAGNKQVASAAETTCLASYHDKDLCKFVAAEAAAPFEKTPLKLTMSGTSGGSSGTWTMEQDGQGNDSLMMSGGGQTLNTITLGGQTYMQTTAGGPWVTYGAAGNSSSSSTSQSSPDSSLTDFVKSMSTTKYTKLGKEACGGLTCFKYQVTDSTMPNSTQYVWFDTSRHLMRQYYEADSSTGDKMTMVISYQKVTISKPSPVQDMSSQMPGAQ